MDEQLRLCPAPPPPPPRDLEQVSPERHSSRASVLSSGKRPSGWTSPIPRPQPSTTPGHPVSPPSWEPRLSAAGGGGGGTTPPGAQQVGAEKVSMKASGLQPQGTLLPQVKAPTPSLCPPWERSPSATCCCRSARGAFYTLPCTSLIAPQSWESRKFHPGPCLLESLQQFPGAAACAPSIHLLKPPHQGGICRGGLGEVSGARWVVGWVSRDGMSALRWRDTRELAVAPLPWPPEDTGKPHLLPCPGSRAARNKRRWSLCPQSWRFVTKLHVPTNRPRSPLRIPPHGLVSDHLSLLDMLGLGEAPQRPARAVPSAQNTCSLVPSAPAPTSYVRTTTQPPPPPQAPPDLSPLWSP